VICRNSSSIRDLQHGGREHDRYLETWQRVSRNRRRDGKTIDRRVMGIFKYQIELLKNLGQIQQAQQELH
jgi:hypothetical protein